MATIFVSGVHSGPDPSPGLGIARSILAGLSDWRTVAVDYSTESSGLHSRVFDEVSLEPTWSEMSLDRYRTEIVTRLREHSYNVWISGLDVEIWWLSQVLPDFRGILSPGPKALRPCEKPRLEVAEELGLKVPEWLPAWVPQTELHRFGRRWGWRLWVKGRFHGAREARSWPGLLEAISAEERSWPLEHLFVQRHIHGLEESIVFAAFEGRLLGAMKVEKRSVTSRGKTWSASVTELRGPEIRRLERFIAQVAWTGGGEVEYVAADGEQYLIDLNPRFPAYVHGVTLCGGNLPAALVGAFAGMEPRAVERSANQFTRVVWEIPVKGEWAVPPLAPPDRGTTTAGGKHPSGQPGLVERVLGSSRHRSSPRVLMETNLAPRDSVPEVDFDVKTPTRRLLMPEVFSRLEQVGVAVAPGRPRLLSALSLKTQPEQEIVVEALRSGWYAEAISREEAAWALGLGFDAERIILNGPSVSMPGDQPAKARFFDSIEAFRHERKPAAQVTGFRIRLPSYRSRFGVPIEDFESYQATVSSLREISELGSLWGLHFHLQSDAIGVNEWWRALDEFFAWATALNRSQERGLNLLDLGGGWHADDFKDHFLSCLPELLDRISRDFPTVEDVIIEPGKAILAYSRYLVTRIEEVRTFAWGTDCLVDASIADLPMSQFEPPRVFLQKPAGAVFEAGRGSYRILGNICMETDILAQDLGFGDQPEVGDLLVFLSAGGYNSSMSWPFARGRMYA